MVGLSIGGDSLNVWCDGENEELVIMRFFEECRI